MRIGRIKMQCTRAARNMCGLKVHAAHLDGQRGGSCDLVLFPRALGYERHRRSVKLHAALHAETNL